MIHSILHVEPSSSVSTSTTSSSSSQRRSLGNSKKDLHEIDSLDPLLFPQYIKFVNRDWECRQVLHIFKDVYETYRKRIVKEKEAISQGKQKPTPIPFDDFKRKYRIIICGGAPGVGHN